MVTMAMFYLPQLLDKSGLSPELVSIIQTRDWQHARVCEKMEIPKSPPGDPSFDFATLPNKVKQAANEYLTVSPMFLEAGDPGMF